MDKRLKVLVVDDDKSICRWLNAVLTAEGYECLAARSVEDAEPLLHEGPIDLGKPLLIDELLALLRKLTGPRQTPSPAQKDSTAPESAIIGRSSKMLEVYRAVARVAPSTASVLITGASGSGKELVAQAIHAHSARTEMPFTAINCGSFPETILESELFGHEKGAFTGADISRSGLFEATNGGTMFLDEISETSLSFQVKLLRVLQEQKVRRLGSNTFLPIDVRIVAATNKDLSGLIRAGRFREDLYYRLSVVTIQLPSLEERAEDIPLLVQHFLERFNQRNQRHVNISEEAGSPKRDNLGARKFDSFVTGEAAGNGAPGNSPCFAGIGWQQVSCGTKARD